MTQSSIEVLIRARPLRSELRESEPAWDFIAPGSIREKFSPHSTFTFDEIFQPDSHTGEIYQSRIQKNVVRRVAQGYNGTIFAYGQTGSGKSYTMLGDAPLGTNPGITTLCVTDLFSTLSGGPTEEPRTRRTPPQALPPGVEVSVSVLEIYNESLRDLLLPENGKKLPLSIRDGPHGVFVHNAQRKRVHHSGECLEAIYRGTKSRVSASTFMNEESSRSHCIISIHVERTVVVEEEEQSNLSSSGTDEESSRTSSKVTSPLLQKKIVSTLFLVDLAGSERVAKTGTSGVRMVEGGHINKSLTTLTNVINRLTEISNQTAEIGAPRNTFVPYRDSKLTHLLKTAIGGNSFTIIICCISPAVENVDESRSTLQFASRAKTIKNSVSVNEVVGNAKVKSRLLEMELKRLKKQLVAQTIYNWSKDVTIKNLKSVLATFEPSSAGGPKKRTAGGGGGDHLQDLYEQQQFIIEQLTSEKEALQESLDRERQRGTEREDQRDFNDLEEMLQESEKEKEELEVLLRELRERCHVLERENKGTLDKYRLLEGKNKELEELLGAADDEGEILQQEVAFLKSQLEKNQRQLLASKRGDAHLEELTDLHVKHQKLQYEQQRLQRENEELRKKLGSIQEKTQDKLNSLEDENEEVKDHNKILNSYLARLLAATAMVTGDKSLAPPTDEVSDRPIENRSVTAAVRSLTSLASSKREEAVKGVSITGATGRRELIDIIRKQESQLVQKDAQRDIIVDTKLKRMQELVLQIYARNSVLKTELFHFHSDNQKLFQILSKHSSVSSKVAKAGLQPRSLQLALSRAAFAAPPEKPFGHN